MATARLADAWSVARRTFSGARAQASRISDSLRGERAYSEPQMSQAGVKANNEPSMEDILASIRRIIAEDYSAQAESQHQPAAQPVLASAAAQPAMPQASSDILDLNSRAGFRPPMPDVVAVTPPVTAQPQMPRAVAPNLQVSTPVMSQTAPVSASSAAVNAPSSSATQTFAARAVSEFSERLGRSFAAAEHYQREAHAAAPAVEPSAPPVTAREPITRSAVQAVAAAVQSHLAEAQAAQRTPEPVRLAEPQKPSLRPAAPVNPSPKRCKQPL